MPSRRLLITTNGVRGPKGDPGTGGTGTGSLPPGGTTGEVLTKQSNLDGDAAWDAPAPGGSGLPAGGTTGQALRKTSDEDGAANWDTLDAADVGAVPTSRTVNGKALSSNIALTNSDVAAPGFVREASGVYPNRPAGTTPVFFMGPDVPDGDGTTGGGAGAVNLVDFWIQTAT